MERTVDVRGTGHDPRSDDGVDILFDARHIRQSGIGTYIRTQIPHLERVTADRGLRLAVLTDADSAPTMHDATRVITASPHDAAMYTAAEQQVWQHALHACRPRALWVPHYPFPLALLNPRDRAVRLFTTVHDTLHVEDAALSNQGRARRTYAAAMLRLDARRAATVFTPSDATARRLGETTRSARVLVTPIPVDDVWFTTDGLPDSGVEHPFLLYVGNVKRHKNLVLLLEAFTRISADVPHRLVIAGGGETLRTADDRVARIVGELGSRVEVTGQVPFDRLRALVAGSDMLIMPSLYEGAGLPPLEAMASRTAVLASDIPVLRETCGDGADFFDPHDPRALAQLLIRLCGDDDARRALAERGFAHVTRRQAAIDPTAAAARVCSELEAAR